MRSNPGEGVARLTLTRQSLATTSSTSNTDLILKNQEYRATAPIRRYVELEQTDAASVVFARKGDDWVSEIVAGEGALLRLPEIGIDLPLADLYEGVASGRDGMTVSSPA